MNNIIIFLFFLSLIYGVKQPAWALAMIIFMFPVEQLMQVSWPTIITLPITGTKSVNYYISLMGLFSLVGIFLKRERPILGLFNPVTSLITTLLAWAIISILWSRDQPTALEMTGFGLPYYVVRILIGSLLVIEIKELERLWTSVIILGLLICIFILTSPGFADISGRLGIAEGTKIGSNPLALGDLGAVLFLTAILFRNHNNGFKFDLVRISAAIFGVAMVIQSGARGQVISSAFIAILFFPLSAPIKNLKNIILGSFGSIFIIFLVPFAMSLLQDRVAEKRFSIEEMLYGASSVSVRFQNFLLLYNEWIQNPIYMFFGLGYLTFNALRPGEIYSHVMLADFIFELGVPGIVFLILILFISFRSALFLFKIYSTNLVIRSSLITLFGIIAYLLFVANKQGDLWGSMPLYMYIAILGRVAYLERFNDDAEPVINNN